MRLLEQISKGESKCLEFKEMFPKSEAWKGGQARTRKI